MKLLVVLFAVAVAVSRADDTVQVIEDLRDGPVGAIYNNRLELDNGVIIEEAGEEGSAGQSNSQGRYVFITPEGQTVEVAFQANEGGFQAQSDAIPQDHPIPDHVVELLRIAEQQRAEGVQFDEQGFRI